MCVLLWHFDFDMNVMIAITIAVHPPNAFALHPDHLISLTTGRNLKRQKIYFETDGNGWISDIEALCDEPFVRTKSSQRYVYEIKKKQKKTT